MNARYVIALFILLFSFSARAQDQHIVDSLKTVIDIADRACPGGPCMGDTTKAKALDKLAWEFIYNNPDTAYLLCKEGYKQAKEAGSKKYMAFALGSIGATYYVRSDYPKALEYYLKSLKIKESIGDKRGMAKSYNNIGIIYRNQSDYTPALEYHFKSLKIKEELLEQARRSENPAGLREAKKGMAGSYNNIGSIYYYQSDYTQALDYYLMSLKTKEELLEGSENPDETRSLKKGMANSNNNIGGIYFNQSDYPQALDYYFKSLRINGELGNKQGMASSYTNIGLLYVTIYELSLVSSDDGGGSVVQKIGEWAAENPAELLDTAMHYQQKALAIDKENSDEYGMTFKLSGIAEIYFKKGAYSRALSYYHETALLADSIGALQQECEAHSGLAVCYEKQGNYKLALEHYKRFSVLKDSTFNEEKSKDFGKLEAKHEFEAAEAERKRIEEEVARQEAVAKLRRNNLQYSGILILLVVLGVGLLALGKLNVPIRLAEGLIFFSFLLFFEFTLVLLDPYIEQYSAGAPAIKLGFNALLAALIFPIHSLFEVKLKGRLVQK